MDDVTAAVDVAVDAVGDALLGEDGIGTAAGDAVDGRLQLLEAGNRAHCDPVIHRDDQIPAPGGDAIEPRADSCGHNCCVNLCQ